MLVSAKWIKSPENNEESCYDYYRFFSVDKKVKSATLNITAMGMYRAFINGEQVGNEIFTPYFTEYNKRVQYQSYNVTALIKKRSEISVICAEGWAVGELLTGNVNKKHYANNISLIFSLDILYADGTKKSIVSDEKVKVRTAYILSSSIYHGETVDKTAKIREIGNAQADKVKTKIIPQQGEKVIEQEKIYPVCLIETPKGEKVIDFGQNLAGYVEVTVDGKYGDIIEISHAEILDANGNFYTENLRSAKQKNTYILSGCGVEIFKPTFTWQGFRYIRLDKYPFDEIDLSNFCAIVVHSDIKRTSDFICGNKKINQLYNNIIWSQKGNFIDIPTDCPQRDERLGWTGDAQVFVRTAAINFDVEKFFEKWLCDLTAAQGKNGEVFWVVPTCNLNSDETVSSAWGDAATICPWEIYMAYGNKKILEKQFESMKKWVEYVHKSGEEEYLWLGGNHFGDWLALDCKSEAYVGKTLKDYIASAYYAYSTALLVKAGKVLGYDMTEYEVLYENIVKEFKKKFIKNGIPSVNTQTAYVLALYFDLCVDKKKTADGFAEMVRENGNKLTTGFVGTPYILHALSENGYIDIAFDLLLQEGYPSWLYSVNHGATTIWEHWDGVKEDGTFWSADMNSYNHYAYGAVYDWIFGVAAGIKVLPDGAGYKHISIIPHTDKRLGFMKAEIKTRRGRLSSHWCYKDDKIYFEFEIPSKTVAEILLPDGTHETVSGGSYAYSIQING